MGSTIPPDKPELDPYAYYCVGILAYQHPYLFGCYGEPTEIYCCATGAYIAWWLGQGWECVNGNELCAFSGYSAQMIFSLDGPYDEFTECCEVCY